MVVFFRWAEKYPVFERNLTKRRNNLKIDVFAHWWSLKAAQIFLDKVKPADQASMTMLKNYASGHHAVSILDVRFKFMNRHPDTLQVLTTSVPPVERFLTPKVADEVCKIENDELAELVLKHPDRFVAAVAALPMNDMDLALKECDRAITQLGLKGILLFTNIAGEALGSPRLRPLYEKMADYNLPIWIHCTDPMSFPVGHEATLGWEYELSMAMLALAGSDWVFKDFPNLKFIIHHLGAMIPSYMERVSGPWTGARRRPPVDIRANLRKLYCDTALYGNPAGLMNGYSFFGADHILFGTDMPLGGAGAGFVEWTRLAIDRMDIPQADKDKIYLENAVNLLALGV